MLLCGTIQELETRGYLTSYFFFQANDKRINNVAAFLRGIIYLIVNQCPSAKQYVKREYDVAGTRLFTDSNAWVALLKILKYILQDQQLPKYYIIVDGLDECIASEISILLEVISELSQASQIVKWIVSSRNWKEIEEGFRCIAPNKPLSLEANEKSVSLAVEKYIRHKVDALAFKKKLQLKVADNVRTYLLKHAAGTFLWVSLVCQELDKVRAWSVEETLREFPAGLDKLYERMMSKISDANRSVASVCIDILAVVSLVHRPIKLGELQQLFDRKGLSLEGLEDAVQTCGSFVIMQNDMVAFVHQSAKEFVTNQAAEQVFPDGQGGFHRRLAVRSLKAMSRILKRNIYNLPTSGFPIEKIEQPERDPLVTIQYSCIHWVGHLSSVGASRLQRLLGIHGPVMYFLRHYLLNWLEALSLFQETSKAITCLSALRTLTEVSVYVL